MIEMRDGVRLATDVHLPEGSGPFPTVVTRTPYGREQFVVEAQPLVAAGYAVVVQDVRGRHGSEGTWVPYRNEGLDGHDTVEWAAAQPWSNGRVGMFGASYGGWTQWAAARERPPHLTTFISSVCCALWNQEWPWLNGALFSGGIGWLAMTAGRSNEPLDETVLAHPHPLHSFAARLGAPLPVADEWLQHPSTDAYWEDITLGPADFARIDLPVLHLTGWFDGCQRSSHWLYEQMQAHASAPQSLLVGPWDHVLRSMQRSYDDVDFGDTAVVDYAQERISWFDQWLPDASAGTTGTARSFTTGSCTWRENPTFPPGSVVTRSWHVQPDGGLAFDPPEQSGHDSFPYDPTDPVMTRPADRPNAFPFLDRSAVHERADVLCFRSEPLEEALEIAGAPEVILYASSDADDTDWFAELVDQAPDGATFLVAHGLVRARYRLGTTAEDLLPAGDVGRFVLSLTPRAHAFRPGHRLVLAVTSSGAPLWAPHPNSGGDLYVEDVQKVARNTVHHGPATATRVVLPVLP